MRTPTLLVLMDKLTTTSLRSPRSNNLEPFLIRLGNKTQPDMPQDPIPPEPVSLIRLHAEVFLVFTFLLMWPQSLIEAKPQRIDFKSRILPLFAKRCSECHGPDAQKSKLRLDTRTDALAGGKSGKPSIVPGQGSQSELYRRITSKDPDEFMPPKGDRMSAEDIEAMKLWIDQGAVWPDPESTRHWAFLKPQRRPVPVVKRISWPRNEIDRFILKRLEQEGLEPMPESDKITLVRRLSLDLTGLPPSTQEVDAFRQDNSSEAYERLVDRLLASQHYGEHVARSWLDLARYADSNGYQVDLARSIWPYRDWVVKALNSNMRFDQFTIEQLAGDLLPNATLEQRVATGFNRNTKINDEGGGDAEEYRTKAVKDRVATTATTWLGLTMMCAECHTHKYDPITQEEYYKFYALFNNTADGGNYSVEPTIQIPAPDAQTIAGSYRMRLAELQEQLAAEEKNLRTRQPQWEAWAQKRSNVWFPLELTNAHSTGGSTYTNLPDKSLLATGVNPIYDTITVEANTLLTGITAVMLEVLPDESLPKQGPGRWSQTGNFILDDIGLWAAPASRDSANTDTNVFLTNAIADWEQTYYRAEHAVDRNPKTGWAIGPQFGKAHFLIAEIQSPVGDPGGTKLGFRFEHYHGNAHTIGRFRISVTQERETEARWPIPSEIAEILRTPFQNRSPGEHRKVAAHHRSASSSIRDLERAIYRLNQRETELANTQYSTLVMQERSEIRPTHIHVRGNFLDKGKPVSPGVPAVLPTLPPENPPNRLSLAKWLVDPENPLPSRVTVNRLWERLFGIGIVKTSEDFGLQGEAPSHPELLDWLATEFIRSGWNLKGLQKTIVLSAAYRQSSAIQEARIEKDPYNRLLSRGPRFRLDGESIRDLALSVSGLLNPQLGGPSVFPYQVPNLWKEIGFLRPEIGMDEWPTSEGPNLYRRALYTFWRRVCTYPSFATFDAPSRDVCVARRPRTNTPLQALAALNDTVLIEAARALGQRIMSHSEMTPNSQVEFAFRLCVSRPPDGTERKRLLELFKQQLASFQSDPQSALKIVSIGSAKRPQGLDVPTLAAWTVVANVILNLDETLTKG